MVEIVKSISAVVATCSEFTAAVVIVIGAIQAMGSAHRVPAGECACGNTGGFPRLCRLVGPSPRVPARRRYIEKCDQPYLERHRTVSCDRRHSNVPKLLSGTRPAAYARDKCRRGQVDESSFRTA